MSTRLSYRLAAFAVSTAVCGTLFSTVATSMVVARQDVRPHLELPTVPVVATRQGQDTPTTYTPAHAQTSVTCANS